MNTCPHGYTIHSITNSAPGCHKCEVDKLKYTIQAITEMNETWRVENEKLRNTIAAKEQTQSETEAECVKLRVGLDIIIQIARMYDGHHESIRTPMMQIIDIAQEALKGGEG